MVGEHLVRKKRVNDTDPQHSKPAEASNRPAENWAHSLTKGRTTLLLSTHSENMTTPMGIAEFRHLETLPEGRKGSLPTVEEIEAELGDSDEPET